MISAATILQRTDEWRAIRVGKCTASRIHDAVASLKSGGPSASREKYKAELTYEQLHQIPFPNDYQSKPMLDGIEREPDARMAYIARYGYEVTEVGFVHHPTIAMSGASPDGLIGTDGVLEIKCPQYLAHWETLKTKKIDDRYFKQIQWQLACTQRKWADYVSWYPDLKSPRMQLCCIRVVRDHHMIERLEAQVRVFLDEVARDVAWGLSEFPELRDEAAA